MRTTTERSLQREQAARAEAEALAEIGRRICASLDLDQVLQTVVESAQRLVHADMSYIALPDSSGALHIRAVIGNRSEAFRGLVIPAGMGVGGHVMATGDSYQTSDYSADTRIVHVPQVDAAVLHEQTVSALAMPVRCGDKTLGVFWVLSRTPRRFSPGEVTMLERLAALAAVAMENAERLAREQAARSETEALLAATATLALQDEPAAVVRILTEQAARLLHAERAAYGIGDAERMIMSGYWMDGVWTGVDHEVSLARSIVGLVWRTGRLYRTNDLLSDPHTNGEVDRQYGLRSQLAVPLLGANGARLGVVSVNNSTRPEGFSEHDERLLTAFCEYASAVLSRARDGAARLAAEREVAQRQREIEALLAAADRLNAAVDPEEVLRRVVEVATELLTVKRVAVVRHEAGQAVIRYYWIDGTWQTLAKSLPLDGSIAGWVIRNRRAYRSHDLGNDPTFCWARLSETPPATMLGVPILGSGGEVLGALNLFDRRDGQPFTDSDERLVEGIAHHAAVALERAALTAQLHRQAFSDSLTGLPNRALFMDHLAHALSAATRRNEGVAVLFLDLDGFKLINDSLGHAVGDELLVSVAGRLSACQRPGDTLARFGGDEFAILLDDVKNSADALAAAERMLTALRRPLSFKRRQIFATASIGIALGVDPAHRRRPEELLREADTALYRAKAAGKGRATVFDASMGIRAVERLNLETGLRRALERGELRLFYQPAVELRSHRISGVEALARWEHPRDGLILPAAFIPLAEETGLILRIGRWVLEEACRQAAIWQGTFPLRPPLVMNVNLSARQFQQPSLVGQVEQVLRETGLNPSGLTLEITESLAMQDAEASIAALVALKRLGVGIAIDDFGTGHSSLSYLQRFPVDTLKVDRCFTAGLEEGGSSLAILKAITSLARALHTHVTAEGIETEAQLARVQAAGCDTGQGYYFARPAPASQTGALLREWGAGAELLHAAGD